MKTKDKWRWFDEQLNDEQIKELHHELDQHSRMPLGHYHVEGDLGHYKIVIGIKKVWIYLVTPK